MYATIPGRTFHRVTAALRAISIQNSQDFSVALAFRPTNGDPVNFTSHLGNSSFVSDSRKNRTCVSHLLFCYFEIEMASLSRIKNYVKQDLLTSLFKFFS